MTELNAGQKHLVANIDKYRDLLRDVARDIEDCKYNRKITHSFDFWPEPISENTWNWIAYQFVSTLRFNKVPNKLTASVKAANRILVKLTKPEGFDRFLEDDTFCKEKIAALFETNYLLDEFLHNKIMKNVPSDKGDKAKNKTDSRDLAGEKKKAGTNTGQKDTRKEPLTDKQNAVLELLKALPDTKGLKGKEILQKLDDKKIYIDQSTLTKSIIPVLKKFHGVKNKHGAGYYIAKK